MSNTMFDLLLRWDRNQVFVAHADKPMAVTQRICVLAERLAQDNLFALLLARRSESFKHNWAELEALLHYGQSKVVWEIALLSRRKAAGALSVDEAAELDSLLLYHDCPDALRLAQLTVKKLLDQINDLEGRELARLQRGISQSAAAQVFDILWPAATPAAEFSI